MSDGWIRMEQNPFNPTEHRSVGADSQYETQDGQRRKTWIAQQHAHAKVDILQHVLNEIHVARLATFLLQGFYMSQFVEGSSPRSLGLHSLRDVLIDQRLKMKLDLLIKLLLRMLAVKERAQTKWQFAIPAHDALRLGRLQHQINRPRKTIPLRLLLPQIFGTVSR